MRVVFSQRLSEGFKKIVPEISILFLIILSVQPQSVLGNSVISPFFCLSAIFYWSLHRQSHFYVVTLIILGTISDILIDVFLLLAVNIAASLSKFARSAPVNPGVRLAILSNVRSS